MQAAVLNLPSQVGRGRVGVDNSDKCQLLVVAAAPNSNMDDTILCNTSVCIALSEEMLGGKIICTAL